MDKYIKPHKQAAMGKSDKPKPKPKPEDKFPTIEGAGRALRDRNAEIKRVAKELEDAG